MPRRLCRYKGIRKKKLFEKEKYFYDEWNLLRIKKITERPLNQHSNSNNHEFRIGGKNV